MLEVTQVMRPGLACPHCRMPVVEVRWAGGPPGPESVMICKRCGGLSKLDAGALRPLTAGERFALEMGPGAGACELLRRTFLRRERRSRRGPGGRKGGYRA